MELECRKCPYFQKERDKFHGGVLIRGFCKLRQRTITEETIGKEHCKDRAVV